MNTITELVMKCYLPTTSKMIVSSEYDTVSDLRTGVRKSRVLVRNIAVLISFSRKFSWYFYQ